MSKSRDAHKQQRRALHLKQLAESLRLRIAQLQRQLSETLAELHGAEPSAEFTLVGYSERPIFNTAKEPSMNDLSKTALEQTLRISKEDAHSIKQALLSAASLSATSCAANPQEAAKCLALAFSFLDEITGPRPAGGGTA